MFYSVVVDHDNQVTKWNYSPWANEADLEAALSGLGYQKQFDQLFPFRSLWISSVNSEDRAGIIERDEE